MTRTDEGSDFATDVCVRRAGKDPRTGQRYVEELSFEVANTQTLPDLERRAEKLVTRGVRRVFAILVQDERVLEWQKRGGWKVRPVKGEIRDRTFEKPLRVRAMVDAASADRLVAEALWAKGEPFLVGIAKKERAAGEAKGRAEALLAFLQARKIEVSGEPRRRILETTDLEGLDRWIRRAGGAESLDEILGQR